MCKVTGFGRDRLSKALHELESKRVFRVDRSSKPNRYFVREVGEWLVEAYMADKKIVPNQDHHRPETGPPLVPNQDSIKIKRLRRTDSGHADRVVGLATKRSAQDDPCTATENGAKSPTHFDVSCLATIDPAIKRETLTFLKAVHEALEGKEYLTLLPPLVREYVTKRGPDVLTLDQLLDKVIRPRFTGKKGAEIFGNLGGPVTCAFRAGHVNHQLAQENPAERESRIQAQKEAQYQRLREDGAI